MSKEVENKNINKKVSSYIENHENNIIENNEYVLNSDEEDERDNEIADQEYYTDTLNIIRKNMLAYIENTSLPLCEYLFLKDIKMLLRKSNNF